MIKGVNKRIVEVVNTGNEYFEKAILFINPEKSDAGASEIMEQANFYVGKISGKKFKRDKKAVVLKIARAALFMVAGFAIAFALRGIF